MILSLSNLALTIASVLGTCGYGVDVHYACYEADKCVVKVVNLGSPFVLIMLYYDQSHCVEAKDQTLCQRGWLQWLSDPPAGILTR